MLTAVALAVAIQGKEISFVELEKLKWEATKDIKNGAGEWEMRAPGEDGDVQRVKVVYRCVDENYYLNWTMGEQRFEMAMSDKESLVVNHEAKLYFKIDTEAFRKIYGIDEEPKKERTFSMPEVEEGTMQFTISQFQPLIAMNPLPKWVGTKSVVMDGRKMTQYTYRVEREDGSLRCEINEWFPEGKWIAEKASVLSIDEEGKVTNAEATLKVLDLSGRLKLKDVQVPKASYSKYEAVSEVEPAYALLRLLVGLKGD